MDTIEVLKIIGFSSMCAGIFLRIFDKVWDRITRRFSKKNEEELRIQAQHEAYSCAIQFLLEIAVGDAIHQAIAEGCRYEDDYNKLKRGYKALIALDDKEGNMKDLWENVYLKLPLV